MKITLDEGAIMPKRATEGSAGYDLYCLQDTFIPYGRSIIKTGVHIQLPMGYEATIQPRSGFSAKGFEDREGVRNNCDVLLGEIDPDYRDAIGVIVKNEGAPFHVAKGTRIAQMVIRKVETPTLEIADTLDETERKGGFGSTGTK